MFDRLTLALALLADARAAFSPLAALAGLSGLGLVLLAVLGVAILPGRLRMPLVLAGAALLALAALWQAAEAKGAHDAYARDAARAIAAERTRAEKAETIVRNDRAQADRDLADARAQATKLKDLTDALAHDPRRTGVCLDRDLSRRLRSL
ncbi:hypothetical protein [uncultured Methylobacterium sp.]|uniref:hypothetical protein n=1 Tax=uncultured Methylobacterium sp. TaxID=157278 RepID=UPI0035CA79D9